MEVGYSIMGTGWLDTQCTRYKQSLFVSQHTVQTPWTCQTVWQRVWGWVAAFLCLPPPPLSPSLPLPGTHTGTEHPQKHYTCLLFLPTRFLQRVCRCARYRLVWRWCHRADSEYQVSAANRDASVNFTPTDFEAGMLNGALTENNHPCCVGRSGILCCDYMSESPHL